MQANEFVPRPKVEGCRQEWGMKMTDRFRRIYAKIDLDAIRKNVENMKAKLVPGTGMMAVIKADGYGHGAAPIAGELEPLPEIWGFGVATAEEAFALREAGIKKPILVLGYTFPHSYERMIREEVRFTVFRNDTLLQLSQIGGELAGKGVFQKAMVHIKVDTGMSRIGVGADGGGLDFVRKALETDGISVEGIFTHMARADEEDKSSAKKQIALFDDFLGRIEKETGHKIPVRHCANSAGIFELPEAGFDLVRAGMALTGDEPGNHASYARTLFLQHHCVRKGNRGRYARKLWGNLCGSKKDAGCNRTGGLWGWIPKKPFRKGVCFSVWKKGAHFGKGMHGSVHD